MNLSTFENFIYIFSYELEYHLLDFNVIIVLLKAESRANVTIQLIVCHYQAKFL